MDWEWLTLSRTIKPDGRCFYLAMDHGYFRGQRLEGSWKGCCAALPYVGALFVTRGVFGRYPNNGRR
jgi:putative autoinducer-2 (AI-2) aldolase